MTTSKDNMVKTPELIAYFQIFILVKYAITHQINIIVAKQKSYLLDHISLHKQIIYA